MPDKDEEQRGYRQYINLPSSIWDSWKKLQAMSNHRRKKAEPVLEMVDQMWGAIVNAGLQEEFERDWENLKKKHGYNDLDGKDKINDKFYREFKRKMQVYIHKPELGMGLSKNQNAQSDVSPPLRWGDRVRRRKLGGEFVNVDRDEE